MKAENLFRKQFEEVLVGTWGDKVFVHKNHGGIYSGAGMPDLTILRPLLPGGFYELKCVTEGGFNWKTDEKGHGITALQLYMLGRIAKAGHFAKVVIYFKEVNAVLAVTWAGAERRSKEGVCWTKYDIENILSGHYDPTELAIVYPWRRGFTTELELNTILY